MLDAHSQHSVCQAPRIHFKRIPNHLQTQYITNNQKTPSTNSCKRSPLLTLTFTPSHPFSAEMGAGQCQQSRRESREGTCLFTGPGEQPPGLSMAFVFGRLPDVTGCVHC